MRVDIVVRDVCFFICKYFDNAIMDNYDKIEG